MNIDLDGEPQAYAPLNNAKLHPLENLWTGGFLSETQNAAKKAKYDEAQKKLTELEQKKADLAKPKPGGGSATAVPDAAAVAALDKQIKDAKEAVKNAAGRRYADEATKPKNYGTIFWHWYGLTALTPAEKNRLSHLERIDDKGKTQLRHPQLDETPMYEDVYGKFPVVQSAFEPGPGYYVSVLPRRVNPNFPIWDQRAFLPPDSREQVAYAALSTVLEKVAGVQLNDMVLAIRLDSGASLAFPFLDRGFKPKVGECSIKAFTSLGGVVASNVNASRNDFILLYLALANSDGQTPQAILQKFARATNAEDLPVILAFIAKATADARKKKPSGLVSVGGNPLLEFEKWKKSASTVMPAEYEVINNGLREAGFNPLAERMMKRHPTLAPSGPWLTSPQAP